MKVTERYQVLPELSAEEYEALKVDIAQRGVQVPVEYDEWYAGWERVEFEATVSARPDKGRSRDRRTEVLWIKLAS